MITDLLNLSLGPFKLKLWLGILAALAMVAGVVIKIADNAEKRKLDTAKEAGAASAIIAGQETVLDQLKDANDVEQEMETGGERSEPRFAECLRNSRIPISCERYRPLPH